MLQLDPNSPEMGHYVDRWLTELKTQSWIDEELEYAARALARAINSYGLQFTDRKDTTLDDFMIWVANQ